MGAGRESAPAILSVEDFDLTTDLVDYLNPKVEPRLVIIHGPVGLGKSLLLRSLVPFLPGPKLFVAYLSVGPSSGGGRGANRELALLVVDPQVEGPVHTSGGVAGSLAAIAAPTDSLDGGDSPSLLFESLSRLPGPDLAVVFIDSWDRNSESYFRDQARSASGIRQLTAPVSAIGDMQRDLISTHAHIVLVVTSDLAAPLQSTADAVVELHVVHRDTGRIRVASVRKMRGRSSPEAKEHVYSLEGARFRTFARIPRGFQPPIGPPDPEPAPAEGSAWPGSVAFDRAFGRLRYGGFSGLTLAPDCPDTLHQIFAIPAAVHILRSGGRVVWLPMPAIGPARVLARISKFVPIDWIRERFRILSASGDDPSLGELRGVILPLRGGTGSGGQERTADRPGVGPIFPDAYRFLRDHPAGTSALYVVSLEGLRAAATAAGLAVEPTTFPVVLGSYARIPDFHGFGFARADDPLVGAVRSALDSEFHAEMVCGRPVVFGVRPETPTYIIDWPYPDGRYALIPVD